MLTSWVNAGGNLIAMRPDKQLAGLLGLTDAATTLADAYMRVDATRAPGHRDHRRQTMQFHGTADRYTLTGATGGRDALLDASTATTNPAVTLRVGRLERRSGGRVHLRPRALGRLHAPGQPRLGGHERDGVLGMRPNDMFFGAGRRLTRLARHEQDRDPAGRRAAAAARQPDHDDGARPAAAAALLVPAARGEGRRRHERRRPLAANAGRHRERTSTGSSS